MAREVVIALEGRRVEMASQKLVEIMRFCSTTQRVFPSNVEMV